MKIFNYIKKIMDNQTNNFIKKRNYSNSPYVKNFQQKNNLDQNIQKSNSSQNLDSLSSNSNPQDELENYNRKIIQYQILLNEKNIIIEKLQKKNK